jgi:hypothetical protein
MTTANSPLTVAYPHFGDRFDAQSQRDIGIVANRAVTNCSTVHRENLASTSFAQLPGLADLRQDGALANPAHHFF